jgi:hypothetical protein
MRWFFFGCLRGGRVWEPVARRADGALISGLDGPAWLRGRADEVRGALDEEQIETSVGQRFAELGACFARASVGVVVISLIVGRDGRVQSSAVASSTIPAADACVRGAMDRVRFRAPPRGIVGVNYRLEVIGQP